MNMTDKCKRCKGTGMIEYYHNGGDHFGMGSSPSSERMIIECPECTNKSNPGNQEATDCYVIVEGEFYQDGRTLCIVRTKGMAIKKCRKDGFSYSKKDDLWSGEKSGKSYYRRIEREDYYK